MHTPAYRRTIRRLDSTALFAALDQRRKAEGLSWTALARQTGVSVATMKRIARALVAEVSEPQRAYANWRRRDRITARVVRREARRLGFPVLEVGSGVTQAQALAWFEGHVGLAPPVA